MPHPRANVIADDIFRAKIFPGGRGKGRTQRSRPLTNCDSVSVRPLTSCCFSTSGDTDLRVFRDFVDKIDCVDIIFIEVVWQGAPAQLYPFVCIVYGFERVRVGGWRSCWCKLAVRGWWVVL